MKPLRWERPGFEISTDPTHLDFGVIHAFLSGSYWAKDIPRALVEKAVGASLPFGVYRVNGTAREQVGFARVISDFATYAYLADVFVLDAHRGQGLSKWLMECVISHPELQGLRRFSLMTRDAQGLYAQYGFKNLARPEIYMEIKVDGIYTRARRPEI